MWTNIGELLVLRDAERIPVSSAIRSKQTNKIYPYYGAAGVIDYVEDYIFDEKLLLIGEDGANLLSKSKDNAFFAEGKYWVNNHAHILDCPIKLVLRLAALTINAINLDPYITGSAQPKLSQDNLVKILIALPPLNEQFRIFKAIELYEDLLSSINHTANEISTLIKKCKSRILQLAISGKLVPQDPADEPAEELLRRINPSAVPADKSHYNIPSSWVWVKLEDIFEINPKNNNINDDDECGFVPMANVQDGYSGKHTFEVRKWREVKKGYCHFQNGDIAVAKISPCFENLKSVIIRSLPNNIGAGTTELVILRCKKVFAPYFLYLFKSQWYISKGTVYFKGVVGQQRVNRDIFTKLAVPLPPLNEQKRIVTKVDELFSLIDTIQQSLEA